MPFADDVETLGMPELLFDDKISLLLVMMSLANALLFSLVGAKESSPLYHQKS